MSLHAARNHLASCNRVAAEQDLTGFAIHAVHRNNVCKLVREVLGLRTSARSMEEVKKHS